MPRLVPGDTQNLRGPLDVGRLQQLDGQHFEQMGEAAARFRPRHSRLPDPVRRALHPRWTGVQIGHELATVQMSPHPRTFMVIDRQLHRALRAPKRCRRRMLDLHVDLPLGHVQLDSAYRPWTAQPQQTLVQILAFHRAPPC